MPRFGRPRHHQRLTDSTNRLARELAERGAPGGTVVTADEQSAGRGRRGRVWSAPAGKALLYSALLRPLESRHALLPLAAPLAVVEAAEAVAPVRCAVKWPNDVWLDERKLAGVLIEARPPAWAVIGVGVNLAIEPGELPADLRWPATSLGHGVGPGRALEALNDALASWVEASDERVLDAYRERDALHGRRISWQGASLPPGDGVADGLDGRGNLVVVTDDGERLSLGSGEVQLALSR